MGRRLGSVSDAELIAPISELLLAASNSDLSIPFLQRPLNEVENAWPEDDIDSKLRHPEY